MANLSGNKKRGFSMQGFDVDHYKQTEGYVQAIDLLYNQAVQEFSKLAAKVNINPNRPFSFADYPATKGTAQNIINALSNNLKAIITRGSREQWLYACKKNDAFLASILNTSKVPKAILEKYQDRNLDALDTFQARKANGMDLSDRIWNYTGQMKTQMELGIDIALGDGLSAQQLSRELRQYLVDPDKLFRRVRDKHGNLVLSKNAKAFNPGQGKYRSSYKNAMRLTRTEINMAYRESDQLRWQQLDFVVGYEIKLSNNHTLNGEPFEDICDHLAGRYPKTFKFKGWHPQCRCHAVPIIEDFYSKGRSDDRVNRLKAALNGTEYKKYVSSQTVTNLPDNFTSWAATNMERAQGWNSQPYFIKENFEGGTLSGAFKGATSGTVVNSIRPFQPVVPTPAPTPPPAPKPKPIEIKTASDVVKATIDADVNNEWFARGFKELNVTHRSGVNGFTDMNGRVSLTQARHDLTISGINKIKNGIEISFEEADAMATFWHEINHNTNKIGNVVMTDMKRRFMELSNEFVSRNTLPEFYKAMGATETPHPELIKSRKSTGYNQMVVNFDKTIDLFGLNRDAVFTSVRKHLINDNYNDQLDGLVDALRSQGISNANGKKLTVNETKDIIKCCDRYGEAYFVDAMKYKGYIK